MEKTKNTRLSLGKRLKIWLIDFTALFFFFNLFRFLISYFYFLPFLPSFLIIWLLYYMISFGIWKQTLGTAFFEVHMIRPGDKDISCFRIFLREWTSLPAILLIIWYILFCSPFFMKGVSSPLLLITGRFVFLLSLLIIALFRAKVFNVKLARKTDIDTNRDKQTKKHIFITYLILLLGAVGARYFHTSYTNDIEKLRTCPIQSPYRSVEITNYADFWDWGWYTAPRPTAHSVKKYVSFLQDNRQDINDYIFSLYDEYDHVILCERFHPEMTQYDMICDLVTDPRFATRVGTVFTEIGNAASRDAYRELTKTSFPDSVQFEQALSSFMMENQTFYPLWRPTNLFDFLKKVYYYNQDKEQKVDIVFTDRPKWEYNYKVDNRDKFMADHIISTIENEYLNKSLTIMNYRHAYLVHDMGVDVNCGAFIAEAFPGKVANVLIHTIAPDRMPLQQGKWDVALEQIPEDAFAFHLSDSPFGKDKFDHSFFFSSLSNKTYEDMFTGMIYYKPLYEHIFSYGFPYLTQPTNIEILKERGAKLNVPFNEAYIKTLGNGRLQNSKVVYFIINLLDNCFFIWNLIIGLGMLLHIGIVYKRQK